MAMALFQGAIPRDENRPNAPAIQNAALGGRQT
jgi:hypothetical protein